MPSTASWAGLFAYLDPGPLSPLLPELYENTSNQSSGEIYAGMGLVGETQISSYFSPTVWGSCDGYWLEREDNGYTA